MCDNCTVFHSFYTPTCKVSRGNALNQNTLVGPLQEQVHVSSGPVKISSVLVSSLRSIFWIDSDISGLTRSADALEPVRLLDVTLILCEVAMSAVVAVTDVEMLVDLVLTPGCCSVWP